MAAGPQDAPRHAGHVVPACCSARNIAIDAETAQLAAAAVQAALQPAPPAAHAIPPPAAGGCSDPAPAPGRPRVPAMSE